MTSYHVSAWAITTDALGHRFTIAPTGPGPARWDNLADAQAAADRAGADTARTVAEIDDTGAPTGRTWTAAPGSTEWTARAISNGERTEP